MKEDCFLCGVTFESDVPANVCPECVSERLWVPGYWEDEER